MKKYKPQQNLSCGKKEVEFFFCTSQPRITGNNTVAKLVKLEPNKQMKEKG